MNAEHWQRLERRAEVENLVDVVEGDTGRRYFKSLSAKTDFFLAADEICLFPCLSSYYGK